MISKRNTHLFVIITFVTLYFITSIISTIHVVSFFELSNPTWLAVSLAIAYEIGAAASLAALTILKRLNKSIVWALFLALAAMQAMGNMYYAFVNIEDYQAWAELFGIDLQTEIFKKRILAVISGAILPLIALGFIKSLIDYIRPSEKLIGQKVVDDSINEEDDNFTLGEDDNFTLGEDEKPKTEVKEEYINKESEIKSDDLVKVENDDSKIHPQTTPGIN